MKKALFAYFGRMYDHTADIPGHPLYSLFLLNSLKEKFGIDKFDVFYYEEKPYNYGLLNNFSVQKQKRQELYSSLINKDNISFDQINENYDFVFLKYRFRNYSRLLEGNVDRYYFDKLYEFFSEKKSTTTFIIDTDAEIKTTENYDNVITFFNDKTYYKNHKIKNIEKIIPVLKQDIYDCLNNDPIENKKINEKQLTLTFIGNGYNKSNLSETLNQLNHYIPYLKIKIFGKYNTSGYPTIEQFSRTERNLAYESLALSNCSINISKEVYENYNFLSPRIFEALLLKTHIFCNYSFMPLFLKFNSILELSEKIKFLDEISSKPDYDVHLFNHIEELYDNITNSK